MAYALNFFLAKAILATKNQLFTVDEASNTPAIVGGVIGGLLLVACVIGAIVIVKRRRSATADETGMGAVADNSSGEYVAIDSVLRPPTSVATPEFESARASHYALLPDNTTHYASTAEFDQMNKDANEYLATPKE